MRMRILLLLIALSLTSCYVLLPHTKVSDGFTPARGLLTSENVKLQFFWELGVVVRTNKHLYLRDGYGNKDLLIGAVNGTNAKKRTLPMELCGDVGVSIEPSKEGTFDAKCVWRIDGWHDVNKIDYLVDEAFFRAVFTKVIGKELHIYYSGDSLLETPDPAVVHRKLTPEESKKIHAEFEERNVGTPAHGTFINEMIFPLDMPVYTITYHRNVKDFKGYEPLELDASELPLEHFDLP